MIASLLIWVYAATLFYLYGRSALTALGRWIGASPDDVVALPLTLVTGMVFVTLLGTLLSIIVNLGALAAGMLLAGGLLLTAITKPRPLWPSRTPQRSELLQAVVMVIVIASCLDYATRAPANADTNAYHAQTIHWIETYRAVPGLGNLNGRLAYNSSWLLLNAAFSFAFLQLRSFHVIAGLLFMVAMLFFADGLRGLTSGSHTVANWLRVIFLPMAAWILNTQLSSPGTDLPVILLAWMLLAAAIDHAGSAVDSPLGSLVVAIMPAFMVTLKLSTAPLLVFSAYEAGQAVWKRNSRLASAIVALDLGILIPWMIHSVILSGYLVFPYPQPDVFHVDWKVPAAYVEGVRNGIIGWSRLPNKNWASTLGLPLQTWLQQWWSNLTLNQRGMLALAAIGPAGALMRPARKYLAPVLVFWLAMLVWLVGAPNFRFGYGVVLGLAAFLLATLLAQATSGVPSRWGHLTAVAAPALIVILLAYSIGRGVDVSTMRDRVLLPVDYYPSRAAPCAAGNLTLYCASINDQCSYAAFPCVPGIPQNVRPRGLDFQDGFYTLK